MSAHHFSREFSELLTRGVAEVIQEENLAEKLASGKTLRIKYGIDPTSPNLHVGRAAALLKLRTLQKLGHTIVFIVGDFTAMIGDTSDKEAERPMLTKEEVQHNLKTYVRQAGKLIDTESTEIHYNHEWLEKLSFTDLCEQTNQFSIADFIARDNIARRLKKGSRVSLREVLYPVMQGYDSVQVHADVEIGGTDQRFNMLAGRTLQEHYGQEPQNIIMLDLLEGLDGRKMSSSWGNTINVEDEPNDMYGKVMSLRDELIVSYFIRATDVALDEVREIERKLAQGENPRDAKRILAKAMVTLYHGVARADDAAEAFMQTFQKGGIPDDAPVAKVSTETTLADAVISAGIVSSKTQWRTLVLDGAVEWMETETRVTDPQELVHDGTLKIGKRRFLRIAVA